MAALNATTASFAHLRNPHTYSLSRLSCNKSTLSLRSFTPMAALTASSTVGLAETFTRLKKQGKYELLDEIMDFGFPQFTEAKILSEFIKTNMLTADGLLESGIAVLRYTVQPKDVGSIDFNEGADKS